MIIKLVKKRGQHNMNALPHLFRNSSQSAAAAIYTRHFDPLIDNTYFSH